MEVIGNAGLEVIMSRDRGLENICPGHKSYKSKWVADSEKNQQSWKHHTSKAVGEKEIKKAE